MHQSNLPHPKVHSIIPPAISRVPRGVRRLQRPAVFALLFTLLLSTQHSVLSTPARAQDRQPGSLITTRDGQTFFVIGANYEGPTDRAWKMWEHDKYDQVLIGSDFARARSLGIN